LASNIFFSKELLLLFQSSNCQSDSSEFFYTCHFSFMQVNATP
jgi:hypothetical protein